MATEETKKNAPAFPTPQPAEFDGISDLPEKTKATLADYLSNVTRGNPNESPNQHSKNEYPIHGNGTSAYSIYGSNNTPASFQTGGEVAQQERFLDPSLNRTAQVGGEEVTIDEIGLRQFETLGNSGMFEGGAGGTAPDDKNLSDIIDKNSQADGNNLLRSVHSTGLDHSGRTVGFAGSGALADAPVVQQKISGILKRNRFSNSLDSP